MEEVRVVRQGRAEHTLRPHTSCGRRGRGRMEERKGVVQRLTLWGREAPVVNQQQQFYHSRVHELNIQESSIALNSQEKL